MYIEPESDRVRKILVKTCDRYKPHVSAKIKALEYINKIVQYEVNMTKIDFVKQRNKSPCINFFWAN
jgi:hypothetical protein